MANFYGSSPNDRGEFLLARMNREISHAKENDLKHSSYNTDTQPQKPLLFEFCWEVARKSGGIYTVIRTKAPVTVQEYGDRYCIVGPYYPGRDTLSEFEMMEPKSPLLKVVLKNLEDKHHIRSIYARWLVKGYPAVILLDVDSVRGRLDELRHDLNSSLPHDGEANEAILFGFESATMLQEFSLNTEKNNIKIIAHFHEWMCGVGIINARRWNLKLATVFTTHATLVGRYLSSAKVDFYSILDRLNIDKEAGDRGIYARHWIEKGSALGAHCFTTVSEITSLEAQHILSRKVDVLVPNGLQVDNFEALHEFQNLHAKYKDVIHEFVRGHFYGCFDFDLENTVYLFTAGRYEVWNKGMDLFIEALARLNHLLKQEGSQVTVVAFIITNAPRVSSFNVESLKGQSILRELRKGMADRIFDSTIKGHLISQDRLMTQEDIVKLKGRLEAIKRTGLPPIVTHNIAHDDEILTSIRDCKLFNAKDDKVKIIYHPEFLNSLNPLLPLEYSEFVRGCHLGIFASYYEPWGYTPAECTVLGVPSVTSNLTGFANFMSRRVDDPEKHGIFIVNRQHKSWDDSATQITNIMWRFCQLSRRQRIELRNRTEKLSRLLDWTSLGQYYENARTLAMEQAYK